MGVGVGVSLWAIYILGESPEAGISGRYRASWFQDYNPGFSVITAAQLVVGFSEENTPRIESTPFGIRAELGDVRPIFNLHHTPDFHFQLRPATKANFIRNRKGSAIGYLYIAVHQQRIARPFGILINDNWPGGRQFTKAGVGQVVGQGVIKHRLPLARGQCRLMPVVSHQVIADAPGAGGLVTAPALTTVTIGSVARTLGIGIHIIAGILAAECVRQVVNMSDFVIDHAGKEPRFPPAVRVRMPDIVNIHRPPGAPACRTTDKPNRITRCLGLGQVEQYDLQYIIAVLDFPSRFVHVHPRMLGRFILLIQRESNATVRYLGGTTELIGVQVIPNAVAMPQQLQGRLRRVEVPVAFGIEMKPVSVGIDEVKIHINRIIRQLQILLLREPSEQCIRALVDTHRF